jgi:hypothetical protein
MIFVEWTMLFYLATRPRGVEGFFHLQPSLPSFFVLGQVSFSREHIMLCLLQASYTQISLITTSSTASIPLLASPLHHISFVIVTRRCGERRQCE